MMRPAASMDAAVASSRAVEAVSSVLIDALPASVPVAAARCALLRRLREG